MTLTVGITGGSGYIGSKLSGVLLERGHAVRILDNFSSSSQSNLADLDVQVFEGDILEGPDVRRFLEGVDFVYDLAGVASVPESLRKPRECFEVNAYGRYAVLDALREKPIQGYLFSSSVAAIYGDPEYTPVDEGHPVKPHNIYGVAKRASELMVLQEHRKWGLPLTVVRQSNVYGPSPGMKFDSVVHIFVQRALSGQPLKISGSGEQVRDFIYIDDLISAYVAILDSPSVAGETLNLAGGAGSEMSIAGLARMVAEITAERGHPETTVEHMPQQQKGESLDLEVSTQRARQLIDFAPEIDLRSGLESTIDYVERILDHC